MGQMPQPTGHPGFIKGGQDVLCGLLFALIGAAGLWIGRDYPMGTSMRLGTGVFPRILYWGLIGIGGIVLLPWLQSIIVNEGWRASCIAMGLLVLLVVAPLNLLVRKRPEDLGLRPDGALRLEHAAQKRASNIVDRNVKNVHLKVSSKGVALVTYKAKGIQRHVIYWGAEGDTPQFFRYDHLPPQLQAHRRSRGRSRRSRGCRCFPAP